MPDWVDIGSDKNIIGVALKRLRMARDLSQEELAEKVTNLGARMDRTAINKIEARTRSVSDFQVLALALALNVSIAELYVRGREK